MPNDDGRQYIEEEGGWRGYLLSDAEILWLSREELLHLITYEGSNVGRPVRWTHWSDGQPKEGPDGCCMCQHYSQNHTCPLTAELVLEPVDFFKPITGEEYRRPFDEAGS